MCAEAAESVVGDLLGLLLCRLRGGVRWGRGASCSGPPAGAGDRFLALRFRKSSFRPHQTQGPRVPSAVGRPADMEAGAGFDSSLPAQATRAVGAPALTPTIGKHNSEGEVLGSFHLPRSMMNSSSQTCRSLTGKLGFQTGMYP